MSGLYSFTNANFSLYINTIQFTDFGENPTPFTHSPMVAKRAIKIGEGGSGLLTERVACGEEATLELMPGSPDSAKMMMFYNSGAILALNYTQIGTLETAIGTKGVVTNYSPMSRGGSSPTYDTYTMQFVNWTGTAGGE